MLSLALALLAAPALPGNWLDRFRRAGSAFATGDEAEGIAALQECLASAPENATVAYHLACAHARAGRGEEALAWLERAVTRGYRDADVIAWDADFAALRGDPRFDALVQRAAAQPDGYARSATLVLGRVGAAKPLAPWAPRALPDGRTVVVFSGAGLRAFDLVSGATLWELEDLCGMDVGEDTLVTVEPDGALTLRRFDSSPITRIPEAFPAGERTRAIALHPGGDRVATWGAGPVRVWSFRTGELVFEAQGEGRVRSAVWSPDGTHLATTEIRDWQRGEVVRVRDARTGEPVGAPIHEPDRAAVAFDPVRPRIATGSPRGPEQVHVWSVPDGERLAALPLGGWVLGGVDTLAWSSTGDLLTASGLTAQCFRGSDLESRWVVNRSGGTFTPLYAIPGQDGSRVYVHGKSEATNSCVVDASTGAILGELRDRGLEYLSATPDDGIVLGVKWQVGTVVLDGGTFSERFRRIEYSGGKALVVTPWLYHSGASERAVLHIAGAHPLDAFAPVLYDPKRVAASAAGVKLRSPAAEVLALAESFPPPPQGPSGGYVDLFMQGTEALEAGDLALARERFAACAARRPNAIVDFHLACVAARAGDKDAALRHLADAVQAGYADPDVTLTDPDLEPLRESAELLRLVAGMRAARARATGGEHAADIDATWPDPVRSFSPGGERSVTAAGDVIDEQSGVVLATLGPLRGRAIFAPTGDTIVTTHPGGVLRVWDARQPRTVPLLLELDGLPDTGARLSFDASGTRLLYSLLEEQAWLSRDTARAMDGDERSRWMRGGSRILRLPEGTWSAPLEQPANALSVLAPDGRSALLGGHVESRSMFAGEKKKETLVRVVDTETGEARGRWHTQGWPEMEGEFRSDGSFALALGSFAAGSGECVVFDVGTGAIAGSVERTDALRGGAVFAGDTGLLLTGGSGGELAWRALPALDPGRIVRAHEGAITSLRMNAEGSLVYTRGDDGFARCWSVGTGEMAWERELGAGPSGSVRVEGDGLLILRGNERFDLGPGTGAPDGAPRPGTCRPARPVVDRKETVFAVPCDDGTVRVVELAGGAERARLATGAEPVLAIELGPRGERIACIGRDAVRLFDARSGSFVAEFLADVPRSWIQPGATFRPDGELLATWNVAEGPALWSAADGARVAWLEVAAGTVRAAAWSPDGTVLATAETVPAARFPPRVGTTTLRTGDTGRPTGIVLQHPEPVTALAFSADGTCLATACQDGSARLWNAGDGTLLQTLVHRAWFYPDPPEVETVQFGHDGAHLLSNTGNQVWLWDLTTGELAWTRFSYACRAFLSDDGRRVCISGEDRERCGIFDARDGNCIISMPDLPGDELVAAGDFEHVVVTADGALRVLDGRTLALNYTWVPFESAGSLAHAPSNHFRGTAGAARWARLPVDGVPYPLDTFAAVLLDPKRVRAAARGVALLAPSLPDPPTLRLVSPRGRVLEAEGPVTIEVLAEDPLALARVPFEVERDGFSVDPGTWAEGSTITEGGTSGRLVLSIPRIVGRSETTVRICAVAGSGVLSLPAVVTIRWRG